MKILHLIYTDAVAGAEKYLKHLLPALSQKGIEPYLYIVCTKNSYKNIREFEQSLLDMGVKVKVYFSTRYGLMQAAYHIARYMKKQQITFLHSHLLSSDIIASLIKLIFNKKVITISTKHGYQENILRQIPYLSPQELRQQAVNTLYFNLSRFLVKHTDYVYAVSAAVSKLYQELGLTGNRMPFIHHGVRVPEPAINNFDVFRRSSPQLVIVGRLETFKGHAFIISAMPEILKRYPAGKLVIVGNGSEMDNLKSLADDLAVSNSIHFTGFHPDPYSFVYHSDLIILPSLFEPFGLVYIEAFALSKTVVAFDTAAGNEIIKNNVTGVLVPDLDARKLAEAILDLLDDENKRTEIGMAAYQSYIEKFTVDKMADATSTYYREIEKKVKSL